MGTGIFEMYPDLFEITAIAGSHSILQERWKQWDMQRAQSKTLQDLWQCVDSASIARLK